MKPLFAEDPGWPFEEALRDGEVRLRQPRAESISIASAIPSFGSLKLDPQSSRLFVSCSVRGPQTPGEVADTASRMPPFTETSEVRQR